MDVAYHTTGLVNALLFAVALVGIGHQLRTIWRRRAEGVVPATEALSLNQLGVSFFAYTTFFIYGYCVDPFNPYLVWPRLAGASLVLAILFELARDRRSSAATIMFVAGAILFGVGVTGLALGVGLPPSWLALPQGMTVVITVLVLQGFGHQILEVRRNGAPGAVSPWMHVSTTLKDVSLLAFGLAMGAETGWPLVVMSAAGIAIKLVLIWHLRPAFASS